MTFKPALWRPIAVVLSAVNLVAVGAAAQGAEPWHAGIHAAVALAFGLWAQRLGRGPAAAGDLQAGLESVEFEVDKLRQELGEVHERLDFAERVLAKGQEVRRAEQE